MPTGTRLDQHVEAYYAYVYPLRCNGFLHRARFERALDRGEVPRVLLLCVCAVASRYLTSERSSEDHPDGTPEAAAWVASAKSSLMADLGSLSTLNLMCLLIIQQHELNCGRWGNMWMLSTMSTRLALGLRLHCESPTRTFTVESEVQRRLVWNAWLRDSFATDGVPEYTTLPLSILNTGLPCSEENFVLERPVGTSSLDPRTFEPGPVVTPSLDLDYDPGDLTSWTLRACAIRAEALQ